MRVVLDDIGADAIKTGMLHDAATIEAVCRTARPGVPLVADPVMVAKGGHAPARRTTPVATPAAACCCRAPMC
jgi:hydroxymethylpyrimidine/phosphomethylpyrimidine kinase